jgi:hypothetical protein
MLNKKLSIIIFFSAKQEIASVGWLTLLHINLAFSKQQEVISCIVKNEEPNNIFCVNRNF